MTTKCGLTIVDPSEYPDTWDADYVIKMIGTGTITPHTDYLTKIKKAYPDFILFSGHEVKLINNSDVIFGYGEVPNSTNIDFWMEEPGVVRGCFIDWCEGKGGDWGDPQADITIYNIPCIPLHLASQPILKGTHTYDVIIDSLLMNSL